MPEILGVEIQEDAPEGWTPLEVYCVFKALDEDGDVALFTRSSEGLRSWDVVGMLTAALDTNRDDLRSGFISGRDEDEDDDD